MDVSLLIQFIDKYHLSLDAKEELFTLFSLKNPGLISAETMGESAEERIQEKSISSAMQTQTLDPEEVQRDTQNTAKQVAEISPRWGSYIRKNLIGIGGMGEVYSIYDERLKRRIAMKIIHSNLVDSELAVMRFLEEAQIGAQLQHPNIVPIHDIGALDDGRVFFTMKEIKGKQFAELIDSVHRASSLNEWKEGMEQTTFRRLIQILLICCEAMGYAHSLEVVHRDLKPENIMIGDFGEVLVVDWGIAKVKGMSGEILSNRMHSDAISTQCGVVTGTPAYMSPEQAHGLNQEIDVPSDIYSMGAILYKILSGSAPYHGSNPVEIVEKAKQGSFESLRSMDDPKIPLELIDICETAMQYDPALRFKSINDMAKRISNWLEGARNREQALAQIEQAELCLARSREMEVEAQRLWGVANILLQEKGVVSERGWSVFESCSACLDSMRQEERNYRTCLQNALVYDHSIEEGHLPLAEYNLKQICMAQARGDKEQQQELRHRFDQHLRYVNPVRSKELRYELEQRLGSHISRLRSKNQAFIGRRELRDQSIAHLEQERLLVIQGVGGVGKSNFAVELAYEVQSKFQIVYFVDLGTVHELVQLERLMAKAMGLEFVRREDIDAQLSEGRILLILDGIERLIPILDRPLAEWIHQNPTLRIIVTSRLPFPIPEAYSIQIEPLPLLPSIQFFVHFAKMLSPDFSLSPDNRDRITKIVRSLEGVPLAMKLAASKISDYSLEHLEKSLRTQTDGITKQALQRTIEWSWKLLEAEEKDVLMKLSVFRGGFGMSAALSVLLVDHEPSLERVLLSLVRSSLLYRQGHNRYYMLETTRIFVENNWQDLHRKKQLEKHHTRYFASANDVDDVLDFDNLVVASGRGEGKDAYHCCLRVLGILQQNGPLELGLQLIEKTLRIENIREDHSARLRLERARLYRAFGHIAEAQAYFKEEPTNDVHATPKLKAARLVERGELERLEARFDTALVYFQEALLILRQQRLMGEQIKVLQNIGDLYLDMEQGEQAQKHYLEALKMSRKENRIEQAEILVRLGDICRFDFEEERALEYYQEAHRLHEASGNRAYNGQVLQKMSTLYRDRKEYDIAESKATRARETFESIGDSLSANKVSLLLARIYHDQRRFQLSLATISKAKEFFQDLQLYSLMGDSLELCALIYSDIHNFGQAHRNYREALACYKRINSRSDIATLYASLGILYRKEKKYEKGIHCFQYAISILSQLKRPLLEGDARGELGILYLERNRLQDAIPELQRSCSLLVDGWFADKKRFFSGALALALARSERFDEALVLAAYASDRIRDTRSDIQHLSRLAEVFFLAQKPQRGAEMLLKIQEGRWK
ncbi:MAG: protein kinase [Myxococcota bacterium]|nr:protein kinase [Myxococcota bacterium]